MKKILLFIFSAVAFLCLVSPSFAANTTISLSPNNGSYNNPFSVNIVIDGHGDVFNAAQATVAVSDNLAVQSLTLGDCNFSYLSTPSVTNLSFTGVILGGSSKKCTVYSLTVAPKNKGNASITLSNASVKRYGDAAQILSSVSNGSYTLTSASQNINILPTVIPSQNGLYSVLLSVQTKDNKPSSDTTVSLIPVSGGKPLTAQTDAKGNVQFTNVKPDVYTATAKKNNNQAKNILNVNGKNHTLVLGIQLEPQKNLNNGSSILIGGLVAIIIVLLFGFVSAFVKLRKYKIK